MVPVTVAGSSVAAQERQGAHGSGGGAIDRTATMNPIQLDVGRSGVYGGLWMFVVVFNDVYGGV